MHKNVPKRLFEFTILTHSQITWDEGRGLQWEKAMFI